MKRRTFILGPFLFTAANCFATTQNLFDDKKIGYSDFLSNVTNRRIAATMGKHYLQDYPNMKNLERLEEAVGIVDGHKLTKMRFETKSSKDFDDGNIVCVEGWVLSKAELSLYALIHIETLNSSIG